MYRTFILLLFTASSVLAQGYYAYVGRVDEASALIAWGTTRGSGNTIGRRSAPLGRVTVSIAGRKLAETDHNWVVVRDLEPNHSYQYEVFLGSRRIDGGTVRTWPRTASKLAFIVIGDYGTGGPVQFKVAASMVAAVRERQETDNPVRFVLTTGDNIYASRFWFGFRTSSGSRDADWENKFFRPYRELLRSIPFYPTLGNHDGDASEARDDLAAYLDNFFFPAPEPSRYYRFSFGDLAEFFALDSTSITTVRGPSIFAPGGGQVRWLERELAASTAPWKIPYFHEPPFTAGPEHAPALPKLQAFVDRFARAGVKMVLNGHEHNFQWSEADVSTQGVRYVVSGAGGQLRSGDVRSRMASAHIAAWAPVPHFLLVEIEGGTTQVQVLGPEPVELRDELGHTVQQPLRVTLQ